MIVRILYFLISSFVGAVALACMMVVLPHALWLEAGQKTLNFTQALFAALPVMFTFGFPVWLLITLTADKRGAMSRKDGVVFGALTGLAAWSYQYSGEPGLWWLAGFLALSGALAGMLYAGLETSRFQERDAERREKWISVPQES
ncbi:MAG: hypothetical protein AAGH82_06290 [Pseudomonadota bacterium]